MSYESPINLIQEQTRIEIEDRVCRAVTKVGVQVDKDELIKALQYDREQYKKGYNDRDAEIVRCKECIKGGLVCEIGMLPYINCHGEQHPLDWFCADGKRKNDERKNDERNEGEDE